MALIKGSTYLISVNGEKLTCQLDATLTLGQDMESEDACKNITPNSGGITWQDDTAGNKNWEVSGSGKVEANDDTTLTTLRTLAKHFITSNEPIEVSVGTNDATLPIAETYSGTAQITSLTANFPATGSATYDYTFTGKGALELTETPIVP